MTSNDIIQLDVLASILDDIGKHLRAIEFEAEKLQKFYGVEIANVGIQCEKEIHLFSGIELVEKALHKVAIDEFGFCPKKSIHHNGTHILQLPIQSKRHIEYRKAEGGVWEVTNH